MLFGSHRSALSHQPSFPPHLPSCRRNIAPSSFLGETSARSAYHIMTDSFEKVGQAFTQHYYSVFDSNRANLHSLYRDQSMLSFEGQQFMGPAAIIQKLVELPFQKVQHKIVTIDCQPTVAVQPNGILVSVSGNLVIDDNQNAMKFAQCFHLLPDPANPANFWVHNDIFRLNLG